MFYVDLRALKVKDRLDKIILGVVEIDSINDKQRDHYIGFSQRELAYFLYKQNKMYGEDIEKQRQIRNMIDALFFKDRNISLV